jgi:hypothetical protein
MACQLGTEPGNLFLDGDHVTVGEWSHLLGQGFPPPAAVATAARPRLPSHLVARRGMQHFFEAERYSSAGKGNVFAQWTREVS